MPPIETREVRLTEVLTQVAREKDIDIDKWIAALEDAMASAAKKQHRIKSPVRSHFDRETGSFDAHIVKTVVEEVVDPQAEWTVEEAQEHQEGAVVGDEILIPISTEGLGSIAAQSAKQVLYQRIREAEREKVHKEFIGRVGEIINGTVKRFERGDIVIDLGRTEAAVPRSEQSRHERYSQGERIRAVIVDVHTQPKGPQVVLSRTDPRLLIKLFEMEVPEIYDGTVSIKAAVRAPGERAKVAVFSRERDVDPVGACVGMKGSRVQSIIRELRGEKIDIIEYSDDLVTFGQSALAPARITRVSVTHHGEIPHLDVIVEDEQLSLAIGKRGQNVRLAAELLGAKIDIKSESDVKGEVAGALAKMIQDAMAHEADTYEPAKFSLLDAPGVGARTAEKLEEAGFGILEDLLKASPKDLEKVDGVGAKTAVAILRWAKEFEVRNEESEAEALNMDESTGAADLIDQPEPVDSETSETSTKTPQFPGQPQKVAMNDGDFMAALSRALEEAEQSDEDRAASAAAFEPTDEPVAETSIQSTDEPAAGIETEPGEKNAEPESSTS